MTNDFEKPGTRPQSPPVPAPGEEFARQAEQAPRNAIVEFLSEFLDFLVEEKKWWLIPIIVSLGLIAIVALLLNSPAAPFIYPLF